jgi:hypothetical protein
MSGETKQGTCGAGIPVSSLVGVLPTAAEGDADELFDDMAARCLRCAVARSCHRPNVERREPRELQLNKDAMQQARPKDQIRSVRV